MALTYLKLGQAGDVDLAYQASLKVVRLKSSQSNTKLALARLHADAVLGVEPMHPDGLAIRGQSLAREGSVHV